MPHEHYFIIVGSCVGEISGLSAERRLWTMVSNVAEPDRTSEMMARLRLRCIHDYQSFGCLIDRKCGLM